MDRTDFNNRLRYAVKGVKEVCRGWAVLLAPAVFVYGFIHEPRYWEKHARHMQRMLDEQRIWSVWVGDSEVNDFYLTRSQANSVAKSWVLKGYDDVFITRR